ncbi:nucleotide-binding domain-containing protein [Hypoxylon sp. NC1633]|nr:nucleotide-binding domain-containing protein [Hypoxylon sp. NC1633]
MKFLISTSFPSFHAVTNASTYVQFCDSGSDLSIPLTSPETVDVWICNGEEAHQIPKSMLVEDASIIPRLQEYAKGRVVEIAGFPEEENATIQWEELILRDAEMLYSRARANTGVQRFDVTKDHDRKTTVLLVGAGIMNLMTAELLAAHGYQVRVVDAGPDPRSCKDWTRLGVTNGGGNARMFTHTEADNCNERGSKIYQNMQPIFRRTVRDGGWSVKPPKDFTAAELAWVNAFEQIPAWLARTFKENIYEVNRESGNLWKEYIKTYPQLFEGVGLCEDILRMYVEPVALDAAVKLNRQLGAIIQATSTEEFLSANPGFRPAAASNHLSGGITVEGFTVNIHLFVAKLIDRITSLGGEFVWDCKVEGFQRNSQGEVTKLESQLGNLEANHFVVSPGVTGNALLNGTACENLIQGVLGIWLQIPNLHPQTQNSIKIHRRGHRVEDINVTVVKDAETGEDILIFGGGYGYVGLDRPPPDSPELAALFDELEQVARIYFPQGYAAAKERDTMYPGGKRKFCVRPFTPTGLGVFERIHTASGGHLIITGGNNTGGFTQAPAVARAVLRALLGEHDPIHVLFHPDRGKLPATTTTNTTRTSQSQFPEPPSSSPSPQSYLRYRLDQAFPGYRCIVETTSGQVRQLVAKRRMVDACYMKYHGLRRRLAGHDQQRRAYFDRLTPADHTSPPPDLTVDSLNNSAVWSAVERWQPQLTIVSGTKYIGRKLMARSGLMLNLHIGHLPEYKGNHCIFFALLRRTWMDGGDVLGRVVPPVLPGDSEETLYARCCHMAIDRCVAHFVPQRAAGRTYRHRDRTPAKELGLWWKLRVGGLLKDYRPAGKPLE